MSVIRLHYTAKALLIVKQDIDATAVVRPKITAWAADSLHHYPKTVTPLVDSGADKNCVSPEFCDAINAIIVHCPTNSGDLFTVADGREVTALGRVKVQFSFEGPSGTKIPGKLWCYVIENLPVAFIVSEGYAKSIGLESPPSRVLAPILFASQCRKAKKEEEERSKQKAQAAAAHEARALAARDATRNRVYSSVSTSGSNTLVGGSTGTPSLTKSVSNSSHSASSTPQSLSSRSFDSSPRKDKPQNPCPSKLCNAVGSAYPRTSFCGARHVGLNTFGAPGPAIEHCNLRLPALDTITHNTGEISPSHGNQQPIRQPKFPNFTERVQPSYRRNIGS